MAQNVLEWVDNSSDETAFLIERKQEACALNTLTFAQIDQVGQNVVLYNDTNVTVGQTYCYRVRATNTFGNSAYTNTAERTVPAFLYTISNPGSQYVIPAQEIKIPLTVTLTSGGTETVSLSVSGVPANATSALSVSSGLPT